MFTTLSHETGFVDFYTEHYLDSIPSSFELIQGHEFGLTQL